MQVLDPELASVVWWGTHTLRVRAHAARGASLCPTRFAPYGHADPLAQQANLRCWEDGCMGIVHSIYAATSDRLARRAGSDRQAVADRMRYARTVVASQVAELDRGRRVARGLPARPTRNDGTAGRINEALDAAAAGPTEARWLVQLFRMIRGYVCRDNRTSTTWPTDAWAAEKCRADGGVRGLGTDAVRQEILDDIHTVLSEAQRVAGRAWVNVSILHPLMAVVGPLTDEFAQQLPGSDPDPAEQALLRQFMTRYAAYRRRGQHPAGAFRTASLEVFGQEPSGDLRDVIVDLESGLVG